MIVAHSLGQALQRSFLILQGGEQTEPAPVHLAARRGVASRRQIPTVPHYIAW